MSENLTVDEFIQKRVRPEFHPVVALIRDLMRECAPHASEVISYGIPAYRGNNILTVISPTQKDITFAFSRGAEFDDPYHLLKGVGHVSKHVKLKNAVSANLEALRYYIQQAVEHDAKST
jgi:hypothetical protein